LLEYETQFDVPAAFDVTGIAEAAEGASGAELIAARELLVGGAVDAGWLRLKPSVGWRFGKVEMTSINSGVS
jgi:hypothetical protein